jgi:hypothetical protein
MAAELSSEESAALGKALTSYLSDLRMEIANTDNAEFRRGLQAERSALESVLAKLDSAASAGREAAGEVVEITLVWTTISR